MEHLSDSQIARQLRISAWLVFSPSTLLCYEYLITLDDEIARYWSAGRSWGSALFFLNRYVALLGSVPVVVEFMLASMNADARRKQLCSAFQSYHSYFALFSQVLVCVIIVTRTYALYGRNRIALTAMVTVVGALVTLAIVILVRGGDDGALSRNLLAIGCPSATSHPQSISTFPSPRTCVCVIVLTAIRDCDCLERDGKEHCLLIFDCMIFFMTLWKAVRFSFRGRENSGTLLHVLVRDGSMYFGLMAIANAVNIGTYTMGGPIMSGAVTTGVNILSSVLVSRLMLNIRDPRLPFRSSGSRGGARDLSSTSTHAGAATRTALRGSLAMNMETDIALDSVWVGDGAPADSGADPYVEEYELVEAGLPTNMLRR
ncbi:unnamed protein product [Mycena citricolor]|uniref:DUF6533 domain-containing protein n=1 Tax=Mycena citricolor TaxID=2018698 RepID=A0AAD2HBB7_9AGAR|nr:unnamed protein product [Mycena citricolor]